MMFHRVLSALFVLVLLHCNTAESAYLTQAGLERESSGENEENIDFKTWLKQQEEDEEGDLEEDNLDEYSGSGIPHVENCDRMLDITFILDGSQSIGPIGFRTIKSYTKQILDQLDLMDCDNVAIIKFTDFANTEKYLGSKDTKESIFARIDALEGPETLDVFEVNNSKVAMALLVADEIVFANQLGSRPNSKKYLVLMTDGKQPRHDSANQSFTVEKMVKKLSNRGIEILVLGVGKDPSIDDLVKLTKSERNVFPERQLNDLMDVLVPTEKHPNVINLMIPDLFLTDDTKDENTNNFGN